MLFFTEPSEAYRHLFALLVPAAPFRSRLLEPCADAAFGRDAGRSAAACRRTRGVERAPILAAWRLWLVLLALDAARCATARDASRERISAAASIGSITSVDPPYGQNRRELARVALPLSSSGEDEPAELDECPSSHATCEGAYRGAAARSASYVTSTGTPSPSSRWSTRKKGLFESTTAERPCTSMDSS